MANSKFVLTCTVQDSAQAVKDTLGLTRGSPALLLTTLAQYFQDMSSGITACSILAQQTAVAATGTVTFSSIAAADTVTIGGTVFTGSDTPSGTSQFLTGSTDTASAASLAVAINANTTTNKYLSATSALGVVTITCLIPGVIGNSISLAISAHGSVSGSGRMTSGSNDTNVTISHGI